MTTNGLKGTPRCPACKERLDGASGLDGALVPKDGDLSVCIYCAAGLAYVVDNTGSYSLRAVTSDEASNKKLKEAQEMVRGFIAKRGR